VALESLFPAKEESSALPRADDLHGLKRGDRAMTQKSFVAVFYGFLFVGFLPGQTPGGIPNDDSRTAPSPPALTDTSADSAAVLPKEAPSPIPGNGI
jgi:hypothetical protein